MWSSVSWTAVLILPQIKLYLQKSNIVLFFFLSWQIQSVENHLFKFLLILFTWYFQCLTAFTLLFEQVPQPPFPFLAILHHSFLVPSFSSSLSCSFFCFSWSPTYLQGWQLNRMPACGKRLSVGLCGICDRGTLCVTWLPQVTSAWVGKGSQWRGGLSGQRTSLWREDSGAGREFSGERWGLQKARDRDRVKG